MHFFRFRFVNTLLFFLIGILVGLILKDRLTPSAPGPEEMRPRYQPEYENGQAAAQDLEDQADAEEAYAPPLNPPAPSRAAPASPAPEPDISVEPLRPGEAAASPAREAALVDPALFFKNPAAYTGREVELPLQMIAAKKAGAGWRLNFSYMDAERRLNYLYAEDGGRLGPKPDLRIGYQYRVRFTCTRGLPDAGNDLASVLATGEKADWATGMSALEQ